MRELLPGIAILTKPNPAPWVWVRVAGDVMDLGLLAAALGKTPSRSRVLAATGSVVASTALDVVCAQQLSER
jgi:hypothetical protein